ncbi:hypothetical protein [Rosistilla oblonga]|uniref:hypothetical protein n=1 Tax=Rosistilla oblonga TaxID=2527990 RepID=UPI003A975169
MSKKENQTISPEQMIDENPQLAVRLLKRYWEIVAMEGDVSQMYNKWQQKKDESLAAKKSYDSAVSQLREAIANSNDPQLDLDFGDDSKVTQWNEIGLSPALGFTQAIVKKFADAGICNIGDLDRLQRGEIDAFPDGADDIVGKNGAERADEVLRLYRPPAEGESEDGDDDAIDEAVDTDGGEDPQWDDNDDSQSEEPSVASDERFEIELLVDSAPEIGFSKGAILSAEITDKETGEVVAYTEQGAQTLLSREEYKAVVKEEAA